MSDQTDSKGESVQPPLHLTANKKAARPDVSEYYDMNHQKRGVALILNHYDIKGQPKREGTDVDSDRMLKELSKLSFDVIVRNDLTAKEIKSTLSEIANMDHTENDCLVVVVMTHGEKQDKLYAKDKTYSVETLWEPFVGEKCKDLIGKPKLFFIQACRGTKFDDGVPMVMAANARMMMTFDAVDSYGFDQPKFVIPSMADFLVMYSTYEDNYSWRNPTNGSWFIQSLCEELEFNGDTRDLLTLLTAVTRKVAFFYQSNVPQNQKMDEKKQCPMVVSMLTRILYFTPKL